MTIKRKLIGSFIISFLVLIILFMGFVLPNFRRHMLEDYYQDIISNISIIDSKASHIIKAEMSHENLKDFLSVLLEENSIKSINEHSVFSQSDLWESFLGSLNIVVNSSQISINKTDGFTLNEVPKEIETNYLLEKAESNEYYSLSMDNNNYYVFPFYSNDSDLLYYRLIEKDVLMAKGYESIRTIVNIGILFIFAFSGFLLFFIHKIVILPIRELNNVTTEIVATGNTNLKVDIDCSDEIGETANSFNEMVDTIRRIQNGLEEKVIERTEKLEAAKAEAVAASKAKSEFLANMSHEIRTPINAVIGLNDLLSKTSLTFKQKDYVEKISMAASNLLKIINDILDFSKVEAGKMTIESINFNIDDIIEDISGIIGIKAANQEIEFVINVDTNIPKSLKGDPKRLTQVLLNLINNAIKFTNQGEVLLAIKLIEDYGESVKLKFLIKDTGIGMKSEVIETLFDQFTQADASTTRNYGGTGLGLAISQNILALMDSTIEVDSTLGLGSTFKFDLILPKVSDETRASFFKSYDFSDKTLLIVDDNDDQLLTFSEYLKPFFTSIEMVSNGYAALDLLINHNFDLMIIDYKMHPVNGFEVLDKIKENNNILKPNKIILTTAYGKDLLDDQLNKYPIDWILMKPVQQKKLLENINNVFSNISNATHEKVKGHLTKTVTGNILIAEDNEINRMVLLENLKNRGFNVDTAVNGQEAFEKAVNKNYDLILMDLQMPVYSGYESSKRIRENSLIVPIIALSADVFSGVKEKVKAAGMNDYLSKPIDFDKLYQLISKYTNNSFTKKEKSKDEIIDNMIKELPSFEVKEGIARIGGSTDKYLETIEKFKEMIDSMYREIKSFDQIEADELEKKLHQFKGASGNLGFEEGYKLSSVLEKKLTKGEAISETTLEHFSNVLINALQEIETIIERNTFNKTNNNKNLIKILMTIGKKANNYDVEAYSNLIEFKENFIEKGYEGEFNQIKSNLSNYSYEKATKQIKQLIDKINKV
jgi:signal transduction histidine kinase/DNA-binding response OmpR family regulator/HPt (histidine-containing phosphotransfer) domain-containing protein